MGAEFSNVITLVKGDSRGRWGTFMPDRKGELGFINVRCDGFRIGGKCVIVFMGWDVDWTNGFEEVDGTCELWDAGCRVSFVDDTGVILVLSSASDNLSSS